MSRCDVGLPPGIRSNYGSDHLLVRRAERTILYLAARSQLHLTGSPNGTTGQLSPSMIKGQDHFLANVLTGGESGTVDFHPPTLGRNQEEKKDCQKKLTVCTLRKGDTGCHQSRNSFRMGPKEAALEKGLQDSKRDLEVCSSLKVECSLKT